MTATRKGGGAPRSRPLVWERGPMLTIDDHWPRDAAHRWRIYRLRRGALDVLRATGDLEAVGPAILDCRDQGDLGRTDGVGVLDVTMGRDEPPQFGEWLINPFGGTTR